MSLYGSFIRNVAFPLLGAISGMPISAELAKLMDSQWWTQSELEDLQASKLSKLINHAYQTVPHYREIMQEGGLTPADIRSLDDLPKLPLLTREQVQELFPDRIVSNCIEHQRYSVARTGGSTGNPLVFYIDHHVRTMDRACYYRFFRWAGYEIGEPMLSLWGAPVVLPKPQRVIRSIKERLVSRILAFDCFKMNDELFAQFAEAIRRFHPKVIRGYTSAMIEFADYVEEHAIELPSLNGVSTTAEVLHDWQRDRIQRTLRCPVFDLYGCGEVNSIGFECDLHEGLHVAAEHVIVEIVDSQGVPVGPGNLGDVALTNLDNFVMPFIRYLNGDQAVAIGEECPCGRGLPLMSNIVGRTIDLIIGLNGKKVHGEFFTHLLHELGWTEGIHVKQFQVRQINESELDFKIVSAKRPSTQQQKQMVRTIREYLGPLDVDLQFVDSIVPAASGKRRFTISYLSSKASD